MELAVQVMYEPGARLSDEGKEHERMQKRALHPELRNPLVKMNSPELRLAPHGLCHVS